MTTRLNRPLALVLVGVLALASMALVACEDDGNGDDVTDPGVAAPNDSDGATPPGDATDATEVATEDTTEGTATEEATAVETITGQGGSGPGGSGAAGELQPPGPGETPTVPELTEEDIGDHRQFFVRIDERIGPRVYSVGGDVLLVVPGTIEVVEPMTPGETVLVEAEIFPITREGIEAQYPEVFEPDGDFTGDENFLASYEGEPGLLAFELLPVDE